ncbi:hypothetical protein NDU88_005970 [Pleurodeles waltl]|uniref:Uncharacterized protein n=1 Tax=Pleurodeles waltl TaxID=8319 RepID=A0AAV7UJN5_PLEWA|nr:hypothetical protein NDU88_005970 [Pleurodeles waltl]
MYVPESRAPHLYLTRLRRSGFSRIRVGLCAGAAPAPARVIRCALAASQVSVFRFSLLCYPSRTHIW